MISHLIFIGLTVVGIGFLLFSFSKILKIVKLLKKPYALTNVGERLGMVLKVAGGQTKIMRFPIIGFLHALVFWGFLLITVGSAEMILDGISGMMFDSDFANDRVLSFLGIVYDFIIGGGDVFALIILIGVLIFLARRLFMNVKRFSGEELRHKDHKDAAISLTFILLLMITLLGMNAAYVAHANAMAHEIEGVFPISSMLAGFVTTISPENLHIIELTCWWAHVLLIFAFANYLPYSKHFHVFMSLPNVYLSRTEPLTKMNVMENVRKEVELMLNPNAPMPDDSGEPIRFGMKDVEDGSWKFYLDSLTCTQCGRCTSVCPANQTGKKLSPRKIVLDYRRRMEEKSGGLLKEGKTFSDGKSLVGNYTTAEELWACTTCNACAQECPVNIDQPSMILEMRRHLYLEESAAPSAVNAANTNIENNGAPWKYSAADRFNWAKNLKFADGTPVKVPLISEFTENNRPEYLFWVGSACSFDERSMEISRNFTKILQFAGVSYACLGTEETDTGDLAKRSGNEFLFQMQAFANIEVLNSYGITKIVTCDPHDYNTLKNEYADLGGNYEVIHHSELISKLISEGKLKSAPEKFAGKTVTYHDPCYLGRGNSVYDAPRKSLSNYISISEMQRNKSRALCCGAGGTQMFKEAEKGNMEVYEMRTDDALKTNANIIATACPYCMTMMRDGVKMKNREADIKVLDIAEIVAQSYGL